ARNIVPPTLEVRGDTKTATKYTVTLESHQREWMFALEMAALPAGDPLVPYFAADGLMMAQGVIRERVRYPLVSYTSYSMGLNEPPETLHDWLQLPEGFNPRTRQLAQELRRQVPPATPDDGPRLVNAVLEHLRRGNYLYTLEPPLLGKHSVDE